MLFLLTPFGRVSRRSFWLGFVALFVLLAAGAWYFDQRVGLTINPAQSPAWLEPVAEPMSWALDLAGGPLMLALLILFPWIVAMMVLKRLHDRGFGGLMLLWKAVLLAGLAWFALNVRALAPAPWGGVLEIVAGVVALLSVLRVLVIVLFLAGQDGPNRFGPDPIG